MIFSVASRIFLDAILCGIKPLGVDPPHPGCGKYPRKKSILQSRSSSLRKTLSTNRKRTNLVDRSPQCSNAAKALHMLRGDDNLVDSLSKTPPTYAISETNYPEITSAPCSSRHNNNGFFLIG